MGICLNCESQIENTPGRRPKKFCDNKGKCRNEWHRKNKPKAGKKDFFKFSTKFSLGLVYLEEDGTVRPPTPEEIASAMNKRQEKQVGVKSFIELLSFAKEGNSRQEVEAEIKKNDKLSPGQLSAIRAKIQ